MVVSRSRILATMFLGLGIFVLNFASTALSKPIPKPETKQIPVEHYARLPAIRDAAISPDGKSLAAIVEQDGRYVVATFDLTPQGLTNPHSFKLRSAGNLYSVSWANNDTLLFHVGLYEVIHQSLYMSHWLYSSSKNLKNAKSLLTPRTSSGAWALSYNHVISDLWDDPDHILMQFMDNQRPMESVYKINVRTGAYTRILRGSKKFANWIADRQGNLRIGEGHRRKGSDAGTIKTKLKIRQANSDKWESEKDHPLLTGGVYIYGFDADPDVIYVGRYAGQDTRGLYTYNLKTKQFGPAIYHNDAHDIGGIMSSANNKRVVGYYYTDDESNFVYFDAQTQARSAQLQRKFSGFDVSTYDETPDGTWAVLAVSAPDYLPEMILYNFKTNKAMTLSKFYPELKNDDVAMVVNVRYTARDGAKIPGYVTLPPAYYDGRKIENMPFIIYPHGGPASRNYDGFDYRAQFLVSRGYAVLQMNFRGSTGYGKAHKDAGRKNWQVMQEDVVDGVNWLIGKGYADKDRICIMGGSYGGYAAVISAINNPELYACAASFAGVMDIPRLIDDAVAAGERKAIKYSIASGFKNRSEMRQQSPARRTDDLKTPLLLAHGDRDMVVDFKHQYKIMKTALKKSTAKVTYLPLKYGDHYLSRGENRLAYHKALDKFLRDNLGDSPAALQEK